MIKKYNIEIEIISANGLLANKYKNSKIYGYILIEASNDFFKNFNSSALISGKLEKIIDKNQNPIDFKKYKINDNFEKCAIDFSGKNFKFSKINKNLIFNIDAIISEDGNSINNINLNINVTNRLYSFLINNIKGIGRSLSYEIISNDEIQINPQLPSDETYSTVLLRKENKNIKGSAVEIDPKGRILEIVYDSKSRQDSWLYINLNKVSHLKVETGNIFFTPDNKIWISVEKGVQSNSNIINRPCELVENKLIELNFDTEYCGCGIAILNEPYFLDAPKDKNPVMRNKNGKIVTVLEGLGIPYEAVINPQNKEEAIVVIKDGRKNGLSFSKNKKFIPCNAYGIVVYQNEVIVGVDGVLKVIDLKNYSLKPFNQVTKRLGDSIDSMAVDDFGYLWISTSSPDSLYVLQKNGKLILVDQYNDELDGGALFRTRVRTRNNRVLWGRNNKKDGNIWELREVIRKSNDLNNTFPNPPNNLIEPVDLSKAEWWGKSIETKGNLAKIMYKLKKVSIGENTSHWQTEGVPPFSEALACYFVYRDGRWVGGPFDLINPKGQVKTNNNIKSGLPGRYFNPTRRSYVKPKIGEEITFCIMSVDAKYRSTSYKTINTSIKAFPNEDRN